MADDSEALQKAINKVQENDPQGHRPGARRPLPPVEDRLRLERHPPDRPRRQRPTFALGEKSPGFQEGPGK